MHRPGDPLVLVNIWDSASAAAVAKAGAKALATSSAAVAVAQGYTDGEKLPRELLMAAARMIAAANSIPLTVDCEAGYGRAPETVAETAAAVIEAGAIGMNLEDQVMGENRIFSIPDQAARIRAARDAADKTSVPLVINARTDIFLKTPRDKHTGAEVDGALERAEAYAKAGASSFFVPGLLSPDLLSHVCKGSPLPVNAMAGMAGSPTVKDLAALGVARISLGPFPFRAMMAALGHLAERALAKGILDPASAV
ncbi:MAG: isocitrate lyase/phosphoenolpyruvate mutase family protein [Alphaproteobacteria bacterium]